MSRKHQTKQWWCNECEYIESVVNDWSAHAATFNNDKACFNRYVAMQSMFAYQDSQPNLSEMIIECLLNL